MPDTLGKQLGFLLLQLAIAFWCAYDLWFAADADAGGAGVRLMNYVLLFCMGVTVTGTLILMTRGRK